MTRDAVADLPGQIQALSVVLQHVDDAEALFVMAEAAGHQPVDDAFAGVAKGRMAQVVAQSPRSTPR